MYRRILIAYDGSNWARAALAALSATRPRAADTTSWSSAITHTAPSSAGSWAARLRA